MSIFAGSQVNNPNYVLRFGLIAFISIIAFGSVLFWKTQLLFTAEYQDMPITHQQLKVKKQNLKKQQSMMSGLSKKLIQTEE